MWSDNILPFQHWNFVKDYDLSLIEVELIKLCSAIANFSEVTGICQHRKNQYVQDYSNSFKKCAGPLNIRQNVVKSNLHIVTLEEYKQITQYEVLLGQKICRNCVKTIFKSVWIRMTMLKKFWQGIQIKFQLKQLWNWWMIHWKCLNAHHQNYVEDIMFQQNIKSGEKKDQERY